LGLALDELKAEEQRTKINGIEFLIADDILPFTEGNVIDYVSSAYGEGFTIAPASGGGC